MGPLVHLICDLECDGLGGYSKYYFLDFAVGVVQSLNLQIIHQHISTFNNGSGFGPGVSVLLLLAESHLAIHTAPDRHLLNLDLFSCRPLDEDVILKMIKQTFKPKTFLQWKLLSR